MTLATTQDLEYQRDEAQKLIDSRDAAIRLYSNPDFKKLILDEFCLNECARNAQASGNPAIDDRGRADALALAQAPGHLRRFLSLMVTKGNQAEGQMESLNEAIEESRAEDDVDGA